MLMWSCSVKQHMRRCRVKKLIKQKPKPDVYVAGLLVLGGGVGVLAQELPTPPKVSPIRAHTHTHTH